MQAEALWRSCRGYVIPFRGGNSGEPGAGGAGNRRQPADGGMTSHPFTHVFTVVNTVIPEPGAQIASPVDGAVVRWRMIGAVGGPFRVRVLRPAGPDNYTAVGAGIWETPAGTGTEVFAADLPIHAGDLIGVDTTTIGDQLGVTFPAGSQVLAWAPPLAEGAPPVAPILTDDALEVGFNADVQPAPGIASMFPTSGPTTGGTSITISGHDFTGATAVKFGPTAASAQVTVDSETQITATVPPSAKPGPVDVSVTTAAGTSPFTAADQFTYTDSATTTTRLCFVPKLKGKKVKADRRRLKGAGCNLGRVKGKTGKSAKVKAQSAKPGTVLPEGSSVSVKVG